MKYPRFSIKPHTYRGSEGFLVYGKRDARDFPQRVFTKKRATADAVRAALLSNDRNALSTALRKDDEP